MTKKKTTKAAAARSKSTSAQRRSEIAKKAAEARWLPQALFGSPSNPLQLGEDITIPCYVLDDDRRVLAMMGMVGALNISVGGNPAHRKNRLANFASGKLIGPFIPEDTKKAILEPIRFIYRGKPAYGYEATILADICEAVLAARRAGVLQAQQRHIAERCEVLLGAFARVGIIALVDEATGFQVVRERNALEELLKKYIGELMPWQKRFPDQYYQEYYRLRGWGFPPVKGHRPGIVGKDTIDIVYKRLAPKVYEELLRQTPRNEKGKLKQKLHQRLTEDVGHVALQKHLEKVILLMQVSHSFKEFRTLLDRALPQLNGQIQLPMSIPAEGAAGAG